MNKADIHKTVYELLNDIYEVDGMNSTERTLGEIMGIMSMASAMENLAISEKSEPSEHDGCKDCKHSRKEKWEEPCLKCKMNYTDKWEERDD